MRMGPGVQGKGQEKQYNFVKEMKDHMESVSVPLSKLKPANAQDAAVVKVATEELEAGMKVLLARQKLIKIADRSELGWQVVEVYESDEVA